MKTEIQDDRPVNPPASYWETPFMDYKCEDCGYKCESVHKVDRCPECESENMVEE